MTAKRLPRAAEAEHPTHVLTDAERDWIVLLAHAAIARWERRQAEAANDQPSERRESA